MSENSTATSVPQLTLVQLSLLTIIVNWGEPIGEDMLLAVVPDARLADVDALIAADYAVRVRRRDDIVIRRTTAGFLHCTGYMHPRSFAPGSHS
jgi:hypothetical protein